MKGTENAGDSFHNLKVGTFISNVRIPTECGTAAVTSCSRPYQRELRIGFFRAVKGKGIVLPTGPLHDPLRTHRSSMPANVGKKSAQPSRSIVRCMPGCKSSIAGPLHKLCAPSLKATGSCGDREFPQWVSLVFVGRPILAAGRLLGGQSRLKSGGQDCPPHDTKKLIHYQKFSYGLRFFG